MAGNNKVEFDGQTVMDISDSTTTPQTLMSGAIGYAGNGDRVIGQAVAGHVIDNDSGTQLTQRTDLQFKGVYVEDDQTNNVTKVDIVREMTKAQLEQLSGEELKGFQRTTDEPDSLPLTTDWIETDNGDSLTERISDIEDGIEDASNSKQETSAVTFTPSANITTETINVRRQGDMCIIALTINWTNPVTTETKIGALNGLVTIGYISGVVASPDDTSLKGSYVLSGTNLYVRLNDTSRQRLTMTIIGFIRQS